MITKLIAVLNTVNCAVGKNITYNLYITLIISFFVRQISQNSGALPVNYQVIFFKYTQYYKSSKGDFIIFIMLVLTWV